MSTVQKNKDIAVSFYKAIETADVATMDHLLAEDGVFWVAGSLPFSGSSNKAQFLQAIGGLTSIVDGQPKFEIGRVTAEEDRVSLEVKGQMRTKTGVDYNNDYHMLVIIRDDKIVGTREYMDTMLAKKAFGF